MSRVLEHHFQKLGLVLKHMLLALVSANRTGGSKLFALLRTLGIDIIVLKPHSYA